MRLNLHGARQRRILAHLEVIMRFELYLMELLHLIMSLSLLLVSCDNQIKQKKNPTAFTVLVNKSRKIVVNRRRDEMFSDFLHNDNLNNADLTSAQRLPQNNSLVAKSELSKKQAAFRNVKETLQRLQGTSVHLECLPNELGRQEKPCISNLSFMEQIERGIPHSSRKWDENRQKMRFQYELNKVNAIHAHYTTGDYAYLPCRIVGANADDTTIWEKDNSPLFASATRFTEDSRFQLVVDSHSDDRIANQVSPNMDNLLDTTTVANKHSSTQRRDLVINFLSLADSGIYSCRLVGRKRQVLRYRLTVVEANTTSVIYSTKKILHIRAPSVVRQGHPFNLTCSVLISPENAGRVTIDWFRPEHVYDRLTYASVTSRLPKKNAGAMDSLSDATTRWLADSFVQLTSRPSLGIRLFKQTHAERNGRYKNDVVLVVSRASNHDAGLYECRAYEPTNHGVERILDRALMNILVHQPYLPRTSPVLASRTLVDDDRVVDQLDRRLAAYWRLLPGQPTFPQHDQNQQNDGGLQPRHDGDVQSKKHKIVSGRQHVHDSIPAKVRWKTENGVPATMKQNVLPLIGLLHLLKLTLSPH